MSGAEAVLPGVALSLLKEKKSLLSENCRAGATLWRHPYVYCDAALTQVLVCRNPEMVCNKDLDLPASGFVAPGIPASSV